MALLYLRLTDVDNTLIMRLIATAVKETIIHDGVGGFECTDTKLLQRSQSVRLIDVVNDEVVKARKILNG